MAADLARIALFQGLKPADLRSLSERTTLRSLPSDTVLIRQGDAPDALYAILRGKVKVYLVDENGKECVLDMRGPGQYVGVMMLDDAPRAASVKTIEPSEVAVIPRNDFKTLVLQNPDVALQVIRNLIRVARGLNENVRSLAMLDVYGRVARVLLDMAVERDGKLSIPEKLTQKDLANRVGASREMINRILRDLTVGGYVSMREGHIIIEKAPPARW